VEKTRTDKFATSVLLFSSDMFSDSLRAAELVQFPASGQSFSISERCLDDCLSPRLKAFLVQFALPLERLTKRVVKQFPVERLPGP